MQASNRDFDIAIIGGGLAGLIAACLLKDTFSVVLFDPHAYPRHKLCGEYLSREITPLLEYLNLDLDQHGAVKIDELQLTTPEGKTIQTKLPLGGYGISRFKLDGLLFESCREAVCFVQQKVTGLQQKNNGGFTVETPEEKYRAKLVLGAAGKRSGLDKEIGRSYIKERSSWVAIKRHYLADHPAERVDLVAFKGGYAGISRVEDNMVNLCYLVEGIRLQAAGGVDGLESAICAENPRMRSFFKNGAPQWEKPIAISQIIFGRREAVHDQIPMLGDAAGLIHPLCGNGMAMAMHSALLATQAIFKHEQTENGKTRFPLSKICTQYQHDWKKQFTTRMKMGSLLQSVLLNPTLTHIGYSTLARIPSLLKTTIRSTHGKPVQIDL